MAKSKNIAVSPNEETHEVKRRGQIAQIWFRFRKNKMAFAGLIIFGLLVLVAATAPLYLNFERDVIQQNIMDRFQGPSAEHIFGTDQFGRDIFKRVLWGARVSMSVGIGVVVVSLGGGAILGSISGYFGGMLDNVIMRICDMFLAIPGTLPPFGLTNRP